MEKSIDMLRIKTKCNIEDLTVYFNHLLNDLSIGLEVHYYNQSKISSFHENFVIHETIDNNPFNKSDSCINKFWCGFCHNSDINFAKDYTSLFIEFNPNKCIMAGYLKAIIDKFFVGSICELCSCDIALDFKLPFSNFFVDQCRKRNTLKFNSAAGDTMYVGARGSDCRLKVYDKAKEQKLADVVWTRIEFSFKFQNLTIAQILNGIIDREFNIPEVYYYKDLNFNDIDINYRSYVYCILFGFTRFKDYSRRTKEKLKAILKESPSINVIDKEYKNIFTNLIITYFQENFNIKSNNYSQNF